MPGEEAIGYQMYASVHCSNADGYLIILGLLVAGALQVKDNASSTS